MNSSKFAASIFVLVGLCLGLSFPIAGAAQETDSSIAACLKLWGDHPFGKSPQFKTLGTSVKVFGIGMQAGDLEPTSSPSLVLVNPIFNVMGKSTIELMNPNGWYCMRTMVSVLGTVDIRAHCKARLAETSAGSTVLGNNTENRGIKDKGVTMIASVSVERPCN